MAQTTTSISEIARYIDEGIDTMKWCREHLEQRRAVERLRELEITLSALCLALDHEMNGETAEAHQMLRKADWRFGQRFADQDDFVIECG
jgi:hypothetical protein